MSANLSYRIVRAEERLMRLMLDGHPVVVRYSGGKDSSVAASLTMNAARRLVEDGFEPKPVTFSHAHTRVDNPEVARCAQEEMTRAKAYGEKGLVYSGPLYRSMSVEGDKARIAFDHTGGGLIANDGQPLVWFEVAGEDRVFFRAEASIDGDTVVVRSPRVAAPKAVRFGWHQLAVPNLANKEGLPASPFRTSW